MEDQSIKNSLKATLLAAVLLPSVGVSHAYDAGQVFKPQAISTVATGSDGIVLRTPKDMADYDAKWKGAKSAPHQIMSPRPKNPAYVERVKTKQLQKARSMFPQSAKTKAQRLPVANFAPTGIFSSLFGLNQGNSGGGYPPDTHGAVSKTHIVEVVNSELRIWARPNKVKSTRSLSSFLNVPSPTNEFVFDPRVIYDPFSNRWVVVAASFSLTGGSKLYVAVSKTADPTQSFYNLSFRFDSQLDFPMLGFNQADIFVTGNFFDASGSYIDSQLFVFRKAELYAGKLNAISYSGLPSTLAPPIVLDKNPIAYFVSAESFGDQIEDKSVTLLRGENLDNSATATLTKQADVDVLDYQFPPNAWQLNGSDDLDTGDGRFTNASTQIGNSLWNVHTVELKFFSAPRFYEIDTVTSAATQQGFFYENSSSFDFNPSIVANDKNDAFVTWNSTDVLNRDPEQQHEVQTNASGRRAGDMLGVIQAGLNVHRSNVPLTGNPGYPGVQRWGDYSNVVIDPLKKPDCPVGDRAFIFNEVITSTKTWNSIVAAVDYCH